MALLALGLIWAVNFFVLLPAINPLFVELMPHGVTLLSKLLFAVAMAATLEHASVLAGLRHVSRERGMAGAQAPRG